MLGARIMTDFFEWMLAGVVAGVPFALVLSRKVCATPNKVKAIVLIVLAIVCGASIFLGGNALFPDHPPTWFKGIAFGVVFGTLSGVRSCLTSG